jgi:hypothetical protein
MMYLQAYTCKKASRTMREMPRIVSFEGFSAFGKVFFTAINTKQILHAFSYRACHWSSASCCMYGERENCILQHMKFPC